MNWLQRRETPCDKCGALQWEIACVTNRGGHQIHPMTCGACGYRTMICVPKSVMRAHAAKNGITLEYLPATQNAHVCEVCDSVGAEWHHWAPNYLFGEECDLWPKSYLCPACHARWHRIIASQRAEE